MMEIDVADQGLVNKYVAEALLYPLQNVRQLVSMVILHFGIQDDVAKEMVNRALQTIKNSAFTRNLNRLAPRVEE